jgi:signal transduction histidine kinase/CheY-like chemotaxis protein
MPLADYLAFLHSLGWLAALMLAALLPGARGRGAGWLGAFCAWRLLTSAQGLVAAPPGAPWPAVAAVVGGMLWWEWARREWNSHAPARRIGAASHLLALECLALSAATQAGAGGAHVAAWQWPIELLFATLPALLGGAGGLIAWRHLASRGLRLAVVALGAHPVLEAFPGLELAAAAAPWLAAAGLAAHVLRPPPARPRAALACLGGLLLIALAGPAAVTLRLAQIGQRADEELARRAHQAAAPLQGVFAARLAREDEPGSATRQHLAGHARALRRADPLLHSVQLVQLRHGARHFLALAGDDADAAAPPAMDANDPAPAADDPLRAAGLRGFIRWPAGTETGLVAAHEPLRADRFETPADWLVLRYPAAFWAVQRTHARRTGVVLVGLLAGCCALGFVLAARQSIENAQRMEFERARSADQAKTEFLAFLSHEMRTPLQTILGRAELWRTAPDTAAAALHHAAAIESQALLLLRLVSDLLDLGTLEAGKFQLRPHPFSLRQALAAVEDTQRGPARAKGLALALQLAPEIPDALVGDEARLRQVLGNILGNAVKYTAAGRVELAVERAPGEGNVAALVFRVRDTGPGLPPDKIPQLFTLFTRLDSGATFTREGTGVGLALVRRLCALMGGSVDAANRPEGGAEFTVRLAFPLAAPEAPSASVGDALPGPRGKRVLIAEDNAAARDYLLEAVRSLGHTARAVADGPGVLAATREAPWDAVLLDVNLPGRDGISLAPELARQRPRPRLIGCSAEAFAPTREAALAAGMDDFLEKPVRRDTLAAALAGAGVRDAAPTQQAGAGANADESVFGRLHTPAFVTRTRALLAAEWPARHAAAQTALARREFPALRALGHYLLSSARLCGDVELARQCASLQEAADAADFSACESALGVIAAHLEAQADQPDQPAAT